MSATGKKIGCGLLSLVLSVFQIPSPVLVYAMEEISLTNETSQPGIPLENVLSQNPDTQPIPSGSLSFGGPLILAAPQVNGDPNLTEFSSLAGRPEVHVEGYNGDGRTEFPGYATFKAFNENQFSYRYDLGASSQATVDVLIAREGASSDLSEGPFVMLLKRINADPNLEGIEELSVIFRDAGGQEMEFRAVLSAQFAGYEFDLNDPEFDAAQVTQIILRQTNADINPEQGMEDRRGEICVQVGNLDIPVVTDDAGFDHDLLTPFPEGTQVSSTGLIRGIGTLPGFVTLLEPDGEIQSFRYDVGGSEGAVVQTTLMPPEGEVFELGQSFVMAMKNDGNGADALVRLKDTNGEEREFVLNLSDTFQNFSMSLAALTAAVDDFNFNSVDLITIELDRQLSPERLGRIDFYLPIVQPDPFLQLMPEFISAQADPLGGVSLQFTELANAAIYQVQVARDAAFTDIVHEGFPVIPPENLTLNTSGNFFARVRGSKSLQVETGPLSQFSETFQFQVERIMDQRPVLNSVTTDAETGITRIDFSALSGAGIYQVLVSRNTDFTDIVHQGFPSGNFDTVNLETNGIYFVRVRGAIDGDGFNDGRVSHFSDIFGFERDFTERILRPSEPLTPDDITALPGNLGITSLGSGGNSSDLATATDRGVNVTYNTGTEGNSGGFAGGGFTYDDFSTEAIETGDLSGLSELRFGIKGDAASNVKFEIVTDTGAKSFVYLTAIDSNIEKVWSISTSFFNLIDLSKVRIMYFIVEGHDQSGQMMINRLPPAPVIPEIEPSASLDLEDISGLPEGQAGAAGVTSLGSGGDSSDLATATERGVTVTYNTGTEGNSGGFAGGGFTFDDFSTQSIETGDLAGLTALRFGIQGDVERVKLEIVASNGDKSHVFLTGIRSDLEQVWEIPTAHFSGIDLSLARILYFIVEGHGEQGTLTINRLPPLEDRNIAPDASLTTSDITALPDGTGGAPGITSLGSGGDSIDQAIATSRGAVVAYNTGTAEGNSGGFAGGGFTYDDFLTGAVETGNLSSFSEIIFGFHGNAQTVKFEMVTDTNEKASVHLTGVLMNVEQFWRIPMSFFSGIDLAKVRLIYFVVEGHGQIGDLVINRLPPGGENRIIQPSNTLTTDDITDLPGDPGITSLGSGGNSSDLAAATDRGVSVTYNTGTEGSSGGFAGGGFTYDDFSTGPIEVGDLSGLTELRFGLQGDVDTVKLEIVTGSGAKAFVHLAGIRTDAEQVWAIATSFFNGLNLSDIRILYFIVEGHAKQGTLTINRLPTGTASRIISPSQSLTSDDITALPNNKPDDQPPGITSLGSGGDSSDAASVTDRGVRVTYNTGSAGNSGGFAGGGFSFDNFSSGPIESGDLSNLENLVFGIQGDVETVKFEMVDKNGAKNFVHLTGILADTEQFWSIPLALFEGVDLANVRLLYFIVEGHAQQGQLLINRLAEPPPSRDISPDSSLSGAHITNFPSGQAGPLGMTSLGSGGNSQDSVTAVDRGIRVVYNTGTAGSSGGFAGGGLTYDNFSTGPIENGSLAGLDRLVFGIRADTSTLKLEIVTASGAKSFVYLHGVRPDVEQFWSIPTSLFSDIDLTDVRIIYFIIEGHGQQGEMTIHHIPTT